MPRSKHRNTHSVHYNQGVPQRGLLGEKLPLYGYLIVGLSWAVFVVGIGTVAGAWDWVFAGTRAAVWLSQWKVLDGEGREIIDSYYVYAFALNFVILWIWCVVSWIGMKLFRHSKGSG